MRIPSLLCLAITSSLVGGCVRHQESPTYGLVTTMELQLLSPAAGSPDAPNTSRDATFSITARDEFGDPYGGDANIDVYLSYGGVRTGVEVECGARSDAPIETLQVRGGIIQAHQTKLPSAFGQTSIWAVEHGSHVVAASDPIYFPNPTIPNLQTPPDVLAPNATFCTSFEKKFVTVDHATDAGELLIDSVFGNAVTITDTGGTDFRSVYLFTFGRPSSILKPGQRIKRFSGNISKFIGFTEVNFPVIEADTTVMPDPAKLPPPIKLTIADRKNNIPKLNAANSSVVEVSGVVCPTLQPNPNNDANIQSVIDQWVKYSTFSLGDPVIGCGAFDSYSIQLPAKVLGNPPNQFDPTMLVAKPVTIRGMLKNSSGQNPVLDADGNPTKCDDKTPCAGGTCALGLCKKSPYNFWTVSVRDSADITQQ